MHTTTTAQWEQKTCEYLKNHRKIKIENSPQITPSITEKSE